MLGRHNIYTVRRKEQLNEISLKNGYYWMIKCKEYLYWWHQCEKGSALWKYLHSPVWHQLCWVVLPESCVFYNLPLSYCGERPRRNHFLPIIQICLWEPGFIIQLLERCSSHMYARINLVCIGVIGCWLSRVTQCTLLAVTTTHFSTNFVRFYALGPLQINYSRGENMCDASWQPLLHPPLQVTLGTYPPRSLF